MPKQPWRCLRTATVLLSLSLGLTACVTSGGRGALPGVKIKEVPKRYHQCFTTRVPLPAKGGFTLEQAYNLIGSYRVSEKNKNTCGKDLINYSNSVIRSMK
jgi:hypothetical protein